MKFFAVASIAVASATGSFPRLAELKPEDLKYRSIDSGTASCKAHADCAAIVGQTDVTHANFDKCLEAAKTSCTFTAVVKPFVDSHNFEAETTATSKIDFCKSAANVTPVHFGYNLKNFEVLSDQAMGEVGEPTGQVVVTLDKKPAGDTNIMVKSTGYITQCLSAAGFTGATNVPFQGAEDVDPEATETEGTEDDTPTKYLVSISANNFKGLEAIYFANTEAGAEAAKFETIDFTQLTFPLTAVGKNKDGALATFASSILVSLGLTYFAL